ncbi:MAG: sugar transferase [Chloroflexota bacterium]
MLREEFLNADAQRASVIGVDQMVKARPTITPANVRRLLPFMLAGQDAVLIYGAFALAYWTRYGLRAGPNISSTVAYSAYQRVALLLLCVMMPTLLVKGAYRSRLSTEIADEILTIFSSATITVASVLVVTFMLHQFEYSRAVMVYLWILLIVLLTAGRATSRGLQGMAHRRGLGVRRLLVVGASDTGKMIMQSVKNRPDLGYEVVGFVDRRSHTRVPDFGRFTRLGMIDDIPVLIEKHRVDEVIVALPGSAHEEVRSVVSLCDGSEVGLRLVPDLFELSLSRVEVDDIAGIPLLAVQEKPLHLIARATKRGMDLVVGSITAFSFLPILGILALLIRLDSEGPVFIGQKRVGAGGRHFSCFKLRTMRIDADILLPALQARNETTGPIFKMRNDPRCTRVGRYIRRWSLDEVPQLLNVVLGDMSLVGPRPPLSHEVERYEPWQLRRLEAKPGLTGLWQVSGRSNLVFDEMVMMDIMYIDNWSLALDLKIIMRTVSAVLAARGAY